MFKCLNCGHLFEEGEEKRWEEPIGEYGDSIVYEEYSGCPLCKENYIETEPCLICGAYFSDNDDYKICKECMEEYSKNIDACYKAGKNNAYNEKINGFLLDVLGVETIEEILVDYLKQNNFDCSDYIKEDESWFAEMIQQ